MAKEIYDNQFTVIPTGQAMYISLDKPKEWKSEGNTFSSPKYELTLLFEEQKKGVIAPIVTKVAELAKEHFQVKLGKGLDTFDAIKLAGVSSPLKKLETEDGRTYYAIKMTSKYQPKIQQATSSGKGVDIEPLDIEDGNLLRASVKFVVGTYSGNKYIKAVMFGLMKVGAGSPIPEGVGRREASLEEMFGDTTFVPEDNGIREDKIDDSEIPF